MNKDITLGIDMPLGTVVASDEGEPRTEGESPTLSSSLPKVKPTNREPDSYEKRGFQYITSISKPFQRGRWDRLYGLTRRYDQGPL